MTAQAQKYAVTIEIQVAAISIKHVESLIREFTELLEDAFPISYIGYVGGDIEAIKEE